MTADEFCLVYVTARNRAEAERLARVAVGARLAACANILGEIRSFYWWDGAVQDEPECALVLKTRRDLFDALAAAIKAEHSYDCPCVVALPLASGAPDYLAWLAAETATG
jgi:periplasmic divalent cation tolerance protein